MAETEDITDYVPMRPYIMALLPAYVAFAAAPAFMVAIGQPLSDTSVPIWHAAVFSVFLDLALRQSKGQVGPQPVFSKTLWRTFLLVALCKGTDYSIVTTLAQTDRLILAFALQGFLFPCFVMFLAGVIAVQNGQVVVKALHGPLVRAIAAIAMTMCFSVAVMIVTAVIALPLLVIPMYFSPTLLDIAIWKSSPGLPLLTGLKVVGTWLENLVSLAPYVALAMLVRWSFLFSTDVRTGGNDA